jgi:hypothetical protein
MFSYINHWHPPILYDDNPATEWVEIARRQYPTSMVRAKLYAPDAPYTSRLIEKHLLHVPPMLMPLISVLHEDMLYAAFPDELVAKWLRQYLIQHEPIVPRLELDFLPADGYETVQAGWQMTGGNGDVEMTLAVHPQMEDAALMIEAAPHIPLTFAEAAAEGILRSAHLLLGLNTPSLFAHLRIRIQQITPHVIEQDGNLSPSYLATIAMTTLDTLLQHIETAHVTPAGTTIFAPRPLQNATPIQPKFTTPLPIHPLITQKLRLTQPITIQAVFRRWERYANVTFLLTPLPDTDDILCETALPNGVIEPIFLNAAFVGVLQKAADPLEDGIPLVGFRVTLIDGLAHNIDSNEQAFRIAGGMAVKYLMEKGVVVIEAN